MLVLVVLVLVMVVVGVAVGSKLGLAEGERNIRSSGKSWVASVSFSMSPINVKASPI